MVFGCIARRRRRRPNWGQVQEIGRPGVWNRPAVQVRSSDDAETASTTTPPPAYADGPKVGVDGLSDVAFVEWRYIADHLLLPDIVALMAAVPSACTALYGCEALFESKLKSKYTLIPELFLWECAVADQPRFGDDAVADRLSPFHELQSARVTADNSRPQCDGAVSADVASTDGGEVVFRVEDPDGQVVALPCDDSGHFRLSRPHGHIGVTNATAERENVNNSSVGTSSGQDLVGEEGDENGKMLALAYRVYSSSLRNVRAVSPQAIARAADTRDYSSLSVLGSTDDAPVNSVTDDEDDCSASTASTVSDEWSVFAQLSDKDGRDGRRPTGIHLTGATTAVMGQQLKLMEALMKSDSALTEADGDTLDSGDGDGDGDGQLMSFYHRSTINKWMVGVDSLIHTHYPGLQVWGVMPRFTLATLFLLNPRTCTRCGESYRVGDRNAGGCETHKGTWEFKEVLPGGSGCVWTCCKSRERYSTRCKKSDNRHRDTLCHRPDAMLQVILPEPLASYAVQCMCSPPDEVGTLTQADLEEACVSADIQGTDDVHVDEEVDVEDDVNGDDHPKEEDTDDDDDNDSDEDASEESDGGVANAFESATASLSSQSEAEYSCDDGEESASHHHPHHLFQRMLQELRTHSATTAEEEGCHHYVV